MLLSWGTPEAVWAQSPVVWGARETRLANEYLQLLVSEPGDERMADLLWELYQRHGSTALLLQSVGQQAKSGEVSAIWLVLGHLQKRAQLWEAALQSYQRALRTAEAAGRPAVLKSLATFYQGRQEWGQAAAFWEQWLSSAGLSARDRREGWLALGAVQWRAALRERAQESLRKAAAEAAAEPAFVETVAKQALEYGMESVAQELFGQLAQQGSAVQRLDALGQLARLHELAAHYQQADDCLMQALKLLDFRDGRYDEFWRRRVRLHEHAGWLPRMRETLAAALSGRDPRAVLDWVRFSRAVADVDGEMRGLERLLELAPQWDEYRWQWVRLLLDHDGASRAAELLDERLRAGSVADFNLVLLRCEADLRMGKQAEAVERLRGVLAQQPGPDEQKQILAFAQDRSLDAIVLEVLRSRVSAQPSDSRAVFELASFLRSRHEEQQAGELLKHFVASAPTAVQRSQRTAEVAGFMASGQPWDQALALARDAAGQPGAQRADFLRVADLLSGQESGHREAMQWLEKAWVASGNANEGIDVDERLWSLLNGHQAETQVVRGTGGEFALPEVFTGRGFAADDEAAAHQAVATEVVAKARNLLSRVEEKPGDRRLGFRAAWWALRAELHQQAYEVFWRLQSASPLDLEAQRLLLELALEDGNETLAARLLRRLMQVDSARRIEYGMRLAEWLLKDEQNADSALNLGLAQERTGWRWVGERPATGRAAVELLERLLAQQPQSESLLNALTQCLSLQGRLAEAWKRWRQAIDGAGPVQAVALLERFGQLRLERGDWQAYIDAQLELVVKQTDLARRREWFKRFMDRLMWAGEGQRELQEQEQKQRLGKVAKDLESLANRHLLDAFYVEALAEVWLRSGDANRAFMAMQRAYYLAPDTPFSLQQLRDLALRANRSEQAIALQRQVVAAVPAARLAAESRRLVEMLESALLIEQADRVRRRLESRFAQDASALEELASHYEATGQDEAQRRVYEQMAKVRPWDARSALRLALKCLRLADEQAAEGHLRELLRRTDRQPVLPGAAKFERLPLPLVTQRAEAPLSPLASMLSGLDSAPALRSVEISALRALLAAPKPWLGLLPQAEPHLRLRAIEELGALMHRRGRGDVWQQQWQAWPSPLEQLWASMAAQQWQTALGVLGRLTKGRLDAGVEAGFTHLWLLLCCQGMTEAIQWSRQAGVAAEVLALRQRCLLGVVGMMADGADQRFAPGQLASVGRMGSATLLDVMRRLQESQRYAEALELGESLRRHQASLGGAFVFSLARVAESAERWDLARAYLSQVVGSAVRPEDYRGTYDPYLFSFGAAQRLAADWQSRDRDWQKAWQRLLQTPDSAMTKLRQASVAGLVGASGLAAAQLESLWTGDFLWSRSLGEVRGALVPQGSTRGDEAMHQRSYWEEVREMQARLIQEGLGPVVQQANERMIRRLGGSSYNPKTGMEFGQWRLAECLRRLRDLDYPARLRELRLFLAPVDMESELAVEALGELASRLEAGGMAREAVYIHSMLPARAPANPEYALSLIRAAEAAMDTEAGLRFTWQLLQAEPPYKPPQPGDEVLREKHARFLAWDLDVGRLHQLAWVDQPTRVLRGRVPHEVPYLRELALLYEKCAMFSHAEPCWQRLVQAHEANADHGLAMDEDACLRLAKVRLRLKRESQALVALEPITAAAKSGRSLLEALELRAQIYQSQRRWEDFKALLPRVLLLQDTALIVKLGLQARDWGRGPEALDFLVRAERSAKDDLARFDLRLAQLQVLAHDPQWAPGGSGPQLSMLLRLQPRQPQALGRLLDWMSVESKGPRRQAWLRSLRAEVRAGADRLAAAAVLSRFFDGVTDADWTQEFRAAWQRAQERDWPCLELTAQSLLGAGNVALAGECCEVMNALPTARNEQRKIPLWLRVAHARGDHHAVLEIYAELVRMPPLSGSRVAAWAEALEQCGQVNLAREFLQRSFTQMSDSQAMQADLVMAWVAFLQRHGGHETAESVLLRWHWVLQADAAPVLFKLYESWGRLPAIGQEMRKFHLAGGLQREIEFQAAKALGRPLPLRGLR